jgi:signal transduction histidine kinase
VRRRLVLAIAGVAAVAVVLFAAPLGYVLGRSYDERERLRLQRDTVAATRKVDVSPPGADPIELPGTSDAIGVYDRTGRRLAGRGPARGDALVLDVARTGRPADAAMPGTLVAAAPLFSGERISGVLRATRSDAVVARQERQAWLALAALAAGLVLTATLAALLLGRQLARPLERLSGAARRLGDGEFAARGPRSSIPEADAIAVALDATADRLHDLVARERAFSADTSHQLRTPLAALRLELEAMELRGDDSEELRAALGEVDRLQTTVDTLLAVSRDAPRREGVTDLATLIEETAAAHRAALAPHARPLRVVLPAAAPSAQAQPAVVREILDVLLSNAAQHGAGAVTVTVTASDNAPWVRVAVADEGPGIDASEEELFARRSGTGHGIGLALARSLAHAEGGRLALTRRAPGPAFTLTLRAAAPSGGGGAPAAPPHTVFRFWSSSPGDAAPAPPSTPKSPSR